jgi:hypothetical protein
VGNILPGAVCIEGSGDIPLVAGVAGSFLPDCAVDGILEADWVWGRFLETGISEGLPDTDGEVALVEFGDVAVLLGTASEDRPTIPPRVENIELVFWLGCSIGLSFTGPILTSGICECPDCTADGKLDVECISGSFLGPVMSDGLPYTDGDTVLVEFVDRNIELCF